MRFAALFAGGPVDAADEASTRLRAPTECRELAVLAARWAERVRGARRLDPEGLVELLERADAFRRAERFGWLIDACECDASAIGDADPERKPFIERSEPIRQEFAKSAGVESVLQEIAAVGK